MRRDTTTCTRRRVLQTTAGAALFGTAQQMPTAAAQSTIDLHDWFTNVSNYDGIVDKRGQDSVTITVGASGNNGAFAFAPAAVRVDPGTKVIWKWTGDGGSHNVVAKDGSFESKLVGSADHTFTRTFTETGATRYYCTPHKAMGMKGAVVVGDIKVAGNTTAPTTTTTQAPTAGSGTLSDWLGDANAYDGVVDKTGQGDVTVQVGAQSANGAFAFSPAAIRVDPGTTVQWEWTGDGGSHNVVAKDGSFESELVDEADHTFEHTFETTGATAYYCAPHKAMGMKGAILVGDTGAGTDTADANDGDDLWVAAVGLALVMALLSPLMFAAGLWGRDPDGRRET